MTRDTRPKQECLDLFIKIRFHPLAPTQFPHYPDFFSPSMVISAARDPQWEDQGFDILKRPYATEASAAVATATPLCSATELKSKYDTHV